MAVIELGTLNLVPFEDWVEFNPVVLDRRTNYALELAILPADTEDYSFFLVRIGYNFGQFGIQYLNLPTQLFTSRFLQGVRLDIPRDISRNDPTFISIKRFLTIRNVSNIPVISVTGTIEDEVEFRD